VYRPWMAATDEGWTRWVLERWGVPFETVRDSAIRAGRLNRRFDTIVIPSVRRAELIDGPSGAHPRYSGGIGERGAAALREFVEAGGTLVLLGASTEFALRELGVPVRDATSAGEGGAAWFAPGSLLRVEWDTAHRVALGMPSDGAVFYSQGAVFGLPEAEAGVRAIARYPQRDVLLSGHSRGESVVAAHAAAVEARLGAGRVILFGFRPQHRAQTHGTFRALFNALYPE
jgi:hypothetical protein